MDKVKILYIAGLGRSGSTLIDNVLGQIENVFSVGEVHRLWDSGDASDRICGCGKPLLNCEVWQQVLQQAWGGAGQLTSLIRIQQHSYRTRHLLRLLLPGGDEWVRRRLGEHFEALAHFYEAIQTVTGCRLIVDSSKFPSYAYVLAALPNVDVYLLHLVRDARATAFSWQRYKYDPGAKEALGQIPPAKSALLWLVWNVALELMWRRRPSRYMRLHYESFVEEPRQYMAEILDFVGLPQSERPFVGKTAVVLEPTHTVCGNPIRYDQGVTTIQPDRRWQKQMGWRDKWLVTSLAWPWLMRYGYLHKKF